jgi:hypothetical protein
MRTGGFGVDAVAPLLGRLLGAIRAVIGIAALLAPTLIAAPWVGRKEASRNSVRLFARTLGGRDLALGLGTVVARQERRGLSSWIFLGALADACDAGATVATFSRLPKRVRWLVLALTTAAAISGVAIGASINPEMS